MSIYGFFKFLKKISRIYDKYNNRIYNYLMLKSENVQMNEVPKIYGKLYLDNKGTIKVGSNCVINSSPYANVIGGNTRTSIVVSKNALLDIDDNVGLSNVAIFCSKHIKIGKDAAIGGSSKIYDTDFHSLDFKDRMSKPDPNVACKAVHIQEGAFVGAECIILKGVTIGKEAVVGAGSVVTKDIPDYEVWAGNPAKFIKKLK